MWTKSTIPTHEWSIKNKPLQIDIKDYARDTIAAIVGVSEQMGLDIIMQFKDSVNVRKFLVFLHELRSKYFFCDLCIYFDNLAVHRSHIVKDRLDELGIAWIYGPAYSPDLNGVEFVFSQAKHLVKKWRHRALQMKTK